MKKSILFLLVTVVLSCFTSCKNEEDDLLLVDYYPIILELNVVNSEGQNMLDPSVPGNILYFQNTMVYNSETTEISVGWPSTMYPFINTRMYMPTWFGGFVAPYFYDYTMTEGYVPRGNYLYIGELDGGFNGEYNIELNLGGNIHEIRITNKTQKLDVERHYYVDGVEQDSPLITLVI